MSDGSHYAFSVIPDSQSRFREATSEMQLAKKLDPLNFGFHVGLAWMLYKTHRFQDALAMCNEIDSSSGVLRNAAEVKANTLFALGHGKEAVAIVEDLARQSSDPGFLG